jgi:polyvinyl alcohol dehydrogenase (cytochrome)
MKSSLCLIREKQAASFGTVGLMLTITSPGLMLAVANPSAQAQASADVSSATTTPAPSPGDWSQFHRDNMQRWNPFETVIGVNNVGGLGLKWSYTTERSSTSSPAVVGGVVYFGSGDGNVYALNASTGTKLWSFATGSLV